jgi:beta-lactamase regulating signal transducer with metallopeptidase domain
MSISAVILILLIVVIRSLAIHKLPKKTFMVLWGVVLLRLLLPFSIPLPVGIDTATDRVAEVITGITATEATSPIFNTTLNTDDINALFNNAFISEATPYNVERVSPVTIVWILGMIVFALFFIITHFRWRGEYKAALPVENEYVNAWLQRNKIMRTIKIRQSDRVNAPITYGILKPVILFPKSTNWQDITGLKYVLTHELTHIKRFDVFTKCLFAAALCVHWFNPLVWVMYILANRDIEVACDETVVKIFGETSKSAYAMTLIGLEERKSGFSPLCTNFAKNAIEERIVSVMKIKRTSAIGAILSFLLVSVLAFGTLTVFAFNNNRHAYESSPSISGERDEWFEWFEWFDSLSPEEQSVISLRPPVHFSNAEPQTVEDISRIRAEREIDPVPMDYNGFKMWVEERLESGNFSDEEMSSYRERYSIILEHIKNGDNVYIDGESISVVPRFQMRDLSGFPLEQWVRIYVSGYEIIFLLLDEPRMLTPLSPVRLEMIDWFEDFSANIPVINLKDIVDPIAYPEAYSMIQAGVTPDEIISHLFNNEQFDITAVLAPNGIIDVSGFLNQ